MTSPAAAGPKRIALAAVAGAHGIKGELRLKLFADSVASLKAHKRVYVGGELRQIRELRDANKTAIARLDGITDRTAAEALRGDADRGRPRRAARRSKRANIITPTSSGCRASMPLASRSAPSRGSRISAPAT